MSATSVHCASGALWRDFGRSLRQGRSGNARVLGRIRSILLVAALLPSSCAAFLLHAPNSPAPWCNLRSGSVALVKKGGRPFSSRPVRRFIPRCTATEEPDDAVQKSIIAEVKNARPKEATAVPAYEESRRTLRPVARSVTLTRQWFDSGVLMGELTTDDGIPVSQLSSTSRPDWWGELLTLFNSRVLDRISLRMTFTIAWSIAIATTITLGHKVADLEPFTTFDLPGWPHELVGGFLSILLVFRTDQAYGRFWEARKQWSQLSSACRQMGRLVMSNTEGELQHQLIAHTAAFPVTLKQHLRGTKNPREIAAIFNTYLAANSSVIEMVTESRAMPSTVLLSMSNIAARLRTAPRHEQKEQLWQKIESLIQEMADVVSECEKLKCSPLPLSYSRHTSRFFSIFTLTLPFALIKETSPLLIPPICAFVSWVLFVTEEIGHVIEEPFGGVSGITDDDAVEPQSRLGQFMTDEDVFTMFKNMDRDQSGKIEMEDLRTALQNSVGVSLSAEEANSIMSRIDLNGDGYIDYEEFQQAWSFMTGATRVELKQLETLPLGMYCDYISRELLYHMHITDMYWKSIPAQSAMQKLEDQQKQVFERMDKDRSGYLDRREMGRALSQRYSAQEREQIFDDMDLNQDGVIDFREFQQAWTVSDVMGWLHEQGYGEYAYNFRINDVDGNVLLGLTNDDLEDIGVLSIGKRKAILNQVQEWKNTGEMAGAKVGGVSRGEGKKKRGTVKRLVRRVFGMEPATDAEQADENDKNDANERGQAKDTSS